MSLPERVSSPAPPRSFGPQRSMPRLVPQDLDATIPLAPLAGGPEPREVLGMKCLYCQAPVERGTAQVRVNRSGYQMAWQAVPAWICTRCDQPYFERQEVETVRLAVSALTQLSR
ncbi:MAG: hypothetical protein ABUT39_26370 [Acidobacteriota bacterium]